MFRCCSSILKVAKNKGIWAVVKITFARIDEREKVLCRVIQITSGGALGHCPLPRRVAPSIRGVRGDTHFESLRWAHPAVTVGATDLKDLERFMPV